MTKPTGLRAGHELFESSRGRGAAKPTDKALTATAIGRGELLRRATNGDHAARDQLKQAGHADDLELGGGDAA